MLPPPVAGIILHDVAWGLAQLLQTGRGQSSPQAMVMRDTVEAEGSVGPCTVSSNVDIILYTQEALWHIFLREKEHMI